MFSSARNTFYTFLILSIGIVIFGDVMVFSAAQVTGLTDSGSSFAISWKQFFVTLVGIPAALLAAKLPLKSAKYLARKGLILAIAIMSLLIPFGITINGNTNWISFGGIEFQPSEFAKVALIIWAAYVIEKYLKNPKLIFTILFTGFAIILAIVIFGQDLGSAVVMGLILGALLFLSGAALSRIALLGGFGFFAVAVLILAQPYRIARFTAFLHPFAEDIYKNAGWQPAHSLMALASGGFFGAGLGASKQKWGNLAEAHTDFIFAVIGEELGLFGTISILVALSLLVYAIFKISLTTNDIFSRYVGLGIGSWIAIQSIINLASATSLIPVVGVTLPFISYGGSSLLALMSALGFIGGIALRNPEVANSIRFNLNFKRNLKPSNQPNIDDDDSVRRAKR